MAPAPDHRIIPAGACRVPPPFRAFAVRSEEPEHAFDARAPYALVHVVHTDFLDAGSLAQLAAQGDARVRIEAFGDVDYATTSWKELAAAAPRVDNLAHRIAGALRWTGVLGEAAAAYRTIETARIDYLASRGAGFHNDVGGHWPRCLFWVLALDAREVEFVMPHAGVQLPLAPGDLLVFDQAMAHGLCRAGDGGQVLEASFPRGADGRQLFLTGELSLTGAQWEALGSPWLPVEEHERRGALDLMVAEFDERTGAVKGTRGLRHCMKRSTCYAGASAAGGPEDAM